VSKNSESRPKADTKFKPGVSGNPGGRAKLAPEILMLKRDASVQAQVDIIKVWQMPHSEMFLVEQQQNVPAGYKALVSCLNNAIQTGEMKTVNLFLDRVVGKVKDQLEISGEDGGPIETTSSAAEELLQILKAKTDERR